jgi:hypothetical protein
METNAMRVLTCDPKVELLGTNLHAWLDNLEADVTEPILKKHDLTSFQPGTWYSCQKWLDVLNDLAQGANFNSACVAVGLSVGQTIPLPPELSNATLPEILNLWDSMYQSLHRGGDVGHIVSEQISDTHYVSRHTDLYPDDFSYGIAYGFTKRFLPRGTQFKVYYDESVQRRDQGGKVTNIHIDWLK